MRDPRKIYCRTFLNDHIKLWYAPHDPFLNIEFLRHPDYRIFEISLDFQIKDQEIEVCEYWQRTDTIHIFDIVYDQEIHEDDQPTGMYLTEAEMRAVNHFLSCYIEEEDFIYHDADHFKLDQVIANKPKIIEHGS